MSKIFNVSYAKCDCYGEITGKWNLALTLLFLGHSTAWQTNCKNRNAKVGAC